MRTNPHYLMDKQARRRWLDAQVRPLPPHPPVEVAARPAQGSQVPQSALTLAELARRAGFRVELVYSRGTRMGAKGQPLGGGPVDVVTLRGTSELERIAGVWHNRGIVGCWRWRPGAQWHSGGRRGYDELVAELRHEVAQAEGWAA